MAPLINTKELESSLAHFSKIPWCAEQINASGWTPVPTRCREQKSSTEDSFLSTALQTPTTLSRHLTICQASSIPLPSNTSKKEGNLSIPACRTFWQLGSDLNGFPGIAHGGLLATLLDEQMGMLLTINSEFGAGSGTALITEMTVYMNVRYKAPVKTPGIVMAQAECTRKEGRKTFIRACVIDETGRDCVIGEGMFISVPETRL